MTEPMCLAVVNILQSVVTLFIWYQIGLIGLKGKMEDVPV